MLCVHETQGVDFCAIQILRRCKERCATVPKALTLRRNRQLPNNASTKQRRQPLSPVTLGVFSFPLVLYFLETSRSCSHICVPSRQIYATLANSSWSKRMKCSRARLASRPSVSHRRLSFVVFLSITTMPWSCFPLEVRGITHVPTRRYADL